jgi:hypothetical protein
MPKRKCLIAVECRKEQTVLRFLAVSYRTTFLYQQAFDWLQLGLVLKIMDLTQLQEFDICVLA